MDNISHQHTNTHTRTRTRTRTHTQSGSVRFRGLKRAERVASVHHNDTPVVVVIVWLAGAVRGPTGYVPELLSVCRRRTAMQRCSVYHVTAATGTSDWAAIRVESAQGQGSSFTGNASAAQRDIGLFLCRSTHTARSVTRLKTPFFTRNNQRTALFVFLPTSFFIFLAFNLARTQYTPINTLVQRSM